MKDVMKSKRKDGMEEGKKARKSEIELNTERQRGECEEGRRKGDVREN